MSSSRRVTEKIVCDAFGWTSADINRMIKSGEIPTPINAGAEYVFPYPWFAELAGLKVRKRSKIDVEREKRARSIEKQQEEIQRLLKIKDRMEKACAAHWADIMRMETFLKSSQCEYPPIPRPDAEHSADIIPESSGVYFVWSQDASALAYVGQSVNIKLRLRSHNRTLPTDVVSWLLFPVSDITHAEAYYIGIGKPYRNGSVNASEIHKHRNAIPTA